MTFDRKKKRPAEWLGNLAELQELVAAISTPGRWRKGEHWQYRTDNGAYLNFWPSTGTINFQGRSPAAEMLREKFAAVAGYKFVVHVTHPRENTIDALTDARPPQRSRGDRW